ncbi:hypothetical protein HS3_01480 [Bacillus subtilis]|nr:hypothetical protein HS3_01480 [Bacillus subtilis]
MQKKLNRGHARSVEKDISNMKKNTTWMLHVKQQQMAVSCKYFRYLHGL